MKRLFAALAVVLFCAPALALNAPDTIVVTGPNNQQIPLGQLSITINGTQNTLAQALAAGGITVPTAPLLSGNGTALGAVTAINGIPIGGAIPAAGAFTSLATAGIADTGGINTTSNFTVNSNNAISIIGGNSSDTVIGRGAAPNDAGGKLNVIVGDNAGANVNALTGELVLVGNISGQYIGFDLSLNTTCAGGAGFLTAHGEHSLGYETCASFSTAIGNDDQRDVVSWGNTSSGNNTTIGKSAYEAGGGFNVSGIGGSAFQGNSSAIVLTGSPTGTGTWTLTLTPGASTGVAPFSVFVNLTNAETLPAIAAAMVSALQANATWTGALIGGIAQVIDTNNILLIFPGTSITGYKIVTTSAVTASGTFAATITGGFTGNNIDFIGAGSIPGNYATTAHNLFAEGQDTLRNVTTAADDHCVGFSACKAMQTLAGMDAYGSNVFKAAVTGGNSFGGGTGAAQSATTVNGSVIIAPNGVVSATNLTHVVILGNGCMQSIANIGVENVVIGSCDQSFGMSLSGTGNLVLGNNAEVPNPANNGQVSIANGLFCLGCGSVTTVTSSGLWGVDTMAPTAALSIGDAGGAALGPHLAFIQTTPPGISGCTGCTLDAKASDSAGTMTEGTTQTGFVITFMKTFASVPHCNVTSPSGVAITSYAPAQTTLTVVNASTTGGTISYTCTQ